jgi:hypothetical protein
VQASRESQQTRYGLVAGKIGEASSAAAPGSDGMGREAVGGFGDALDEYVRAMQEGKEKKAGAHVRVGNENGRSWGVVEGRMVWNGCDLFVPGLEKAGEPAEVGLGGGSEQDQVRPTHVRPVPGPARTCAGKWRLC